MAVVALVERSLKTELHAIKHEPSLVKVERKFQVAGSKMLLAHHSVIASAEKAPNCREELNDAEGRLGIGQGAVEKSGDNSKTAMEDATPFDTDYFPKAGCKRREIGEPTMQVRQQTASTAASSRKLPAVRVKLELCMASVDFCHEELKAIRKEVADVKPIFVQEKRLWETET